MTRNNLWDTWRGGQGHRRGRDPQGSPSLAGHPPERPREGGDRGCPPRSGVRGEPLSSDPNAVKLRRETRHSLRPTQLFVLPGVPGLPLVKKVKIRQGWWPEAHGAGRAPCVWVAAEGLPREQKPGWWGDGRGHGEGGELRDHPVGQGEARGQMHKPGDAKDPLAAVWMHPREGGRAGGRGRRCLGESTGALARRA